MTEHSTSTLTLTSDDAIQLSMQMRNVPHYKIERKVNGREYSVFVYDGTGGVGSAWNGFACSEERAHRKGRKMLRRALNQLEREGVFDGNGQPLTSMSKRVGVA